MVVCGISGRRRQAAAALAIDGRLVAAVEQAPLTHADVRDSLLPVAAIDACLAAAGVTVHDVSHFVRADGHSLSLGCSPSRRRFDAIGGDAAHGYTLSRLAAFARVAEAAGARAVIVADGPAAMLLSTDGSASELERTRGLLTLACKLATALGLAHDDSAGALTALEQLATSFEPSGQDWFEPLSSPADAGSATMDASAFEKALAIAAVIGLGETTGP